MNDHIAFLEEWGNNSLDLTGQSHGSQPASTHFVIVAVILHRQQLAQAESQLEEIQVFF